MALVAYLVLLLAMTGQSSALYCLCKEGLSQSVLQKAIDYACGAGADCGQILQNGPCFQPNTVQDHCNYAVNSYFQKKGQTSGSCDFAGAATTSANPPQNVASGCVYPSSASTGTGTPTTTPGTGTPTTTPGTGTTPSSANSPGGTSTVFGGTGTSLGPTGSGTGGINDANGVAPFQPTNLILSFTLYLLVSYLVLLWG
ncbi:PLASMODESMATA CALLOSE-BINDING PROTEIN 3 [Melia azedarach]|uniref:PLASMODESMATA CALLOSE-BINDING PROTEIN 3 n=1 Tax=Melia azedarach TaxID=155640 RepID=A0ACC1XIL5_MELAZ|nr:PLASMODESMATA CALLOSE-BINDING PROTEIN 3 [Melia azedarach]